MESSLPRSISLVCQSELPNLPAKRRSDDLINAQTNGSTPSPIKTINGQNVTEWLTAFAVSNSFGLLEPNADWNALMYSPAADIQGIPNAFNGGSSIFPGDELNFVQENGIETDSQWLSLAFVPFGTPTIQNGQDFFNYFVTNEIPDDTSDNSTAAATSAAATTAAATAAPTTDGASPTTSDSAAATTDGSVPTATSWDDPAYPNNPDVVQPDLGLGGVITGYLLNDTKIGVLSIPSFEATGSAIVSFSNTIHDFIQRAQDAGIEQIVIDVQQNYGGEVLLAVDAFKQFFPPIDPFGGSRLRSSSYADALGTTFNNYISENTNTLNETFLDAFIDDPWAVLGYLDASNNQNFTSWLELFGPHPDRGDFFSTVQRNNLSSELFDEVATGGFLDDGMTPGGIVVYGYGNRSVLDPPPFGAPNIILLTDSICHSACALFAEMMHHQAGVRTVVVGGRPNIGPMQAVAGTRGALSYDTFSLDDDIYEAIIFNDSASAALPSSHYAEEIDFFVTSAYFNLRDQIRQGPDEYFPQQFAYEAANCRIYWTMSTFNNFRNLWQYAADAIWTKPELCVKDSANYPSSGKTDTVGPSESQKDAWDPIRPIVAPLTPTNSSSNEQTSDDKNAVLSSEYQSLYGGPDYDNEIGLDLLNQKSKTLDKHCDTKKANPCAPRSQETCVGVSFCENGVYKDDTQCKRQCTQNSDCTSVNGQATFCNVFDVQCTLNKKGLSNCNYLKDSKITVGSGGRKTTVGGKNTSTKPAWTGLCEPRVKTDAKCLALADPIDTPPVSPDSAALASSGVTSVFVDDPTTPSEQDAQSSNTVDGNVQQANVEKPTLGQTINSRWGDWESP